MRISCTRQFFILTMIILFIGISCIAQTFTVRVLPDNNIKSIRGMSVVNDSIIWVSGTGGMVGRSTNGGREWQWTRVSGCDSCDWRSLHAFSAQRAIILNAGAPAHIYSTDNGGQSWERVYFNDTPGIFFDALAFNGKKEGYAIGDPINGHFVLLQTNDEGQHWELVPATAQPVAQEGESLFAASGTGFRILNGQPAFVTGGTVSRFIHRQHNNWQYVHLPLLQGSASAGAFSFAFSGKHNGIAVGGDYRNDTLRNQNSALTTNGGKSWASCSNPPAGYRSCVEYITPQLLIATGTSGTDISTDGGRNWKNISREGFHVVRKAAAGSRVYLAGRKIAVLEIGN